MSLKQFVRAVRATKTASGMPCFPCHAITVANVSDERAVIQKESAAIRTSFREKPTDHNSRRNNVAKLLYLSFLGVPTHFGQIECVKLLASPKFTDKRLGYLGTMLLLDEAQEVLTLVTNSLQHDLAHSNQYIVGLALCTLGNIAGQEMSRDLCNDVEKLLGSTNSYIRKKAALCAMRIIEKVPEMQENFLDRTKLLLADRHHGVLLCGLTLATQMCMDDADSLEAFKPTVPALVKTLRSLVTSGFAPEHDVTGLADPFLQVKLIRFLGVLGRGDAQISEQINDVLAQVASSTEATKNVGNSILYEAVLTILDIEADSGLRVLGVNLLGKFLLNKDNNIRYVALNTLNKVISIEPNAVQRHRSTILECLRDPDISIRRRALDLSFALINESNVRVLIRELLAFLEVADNEFKLNMTTQICIAADRYAPNKRWHIDTVLRVLKLAGNFVREEILSSFIRLVATSAELQTYATQKLYSLLREDITQEALTLAGTWTIGEYGDFLFDRTNFEEEELVKEVSAREIVSLLETIDSSTYATATVSEYIVTALVKLTVRFQDSQEVAHIRSILKKHASSLNVELQQRAVEYENLFDHDSVRRGVLERMPVPEVKEENRVLGPASTKTQKHRKKKSEAENLLDLLGDDTASTSASTTTQPSGSLDLLQDLFSPASDTQTMKSTATNDILGLFGTSAPSTTKAATLSGLDQDLLASVDQAQTTSNPTPGQQPTITALDRSGLLVTMQPSKDAAGLVRIAAKFKNSGSKVSDLNLQAAVPKSMKLQMQALSATVIATDGVATQAMKVTASPGVSSLSSVL